MLWAHWILLSQKYTQNQEYKKTIIIDNLKSAQINSLFKSKKINNLKFYQLDISQKNYLNKFKKIDYIIHLASMTNAERQLCKKMKCIKII